MVLFAIIVVYGALESLNFLDDVIVSKSFIK